MTAIAAIFLFGILIFVHELGHFLFAKLMGVKVLKFSLGFGPKIIGKKYGDTEYRISALPLGGYVKMLGEEPGSELTEEEKPMAYNYKPPSKRAVILLAGSFFNIFLTFIIYTLLLAAGRSIAIPKLENILPVVEVIAKHSPAETAGIMTGDKIMAIDGDDVNTWDEMKQQIMNKPGEELAVKLKRNGQTLDIQVRAEQRVEHIEGEDIIIGWIGIVKSPILDVVIEDSPAQKAGLIDDDIVLAVNGKNVNTWEEMSNIIEKHPGEKILLTIKRGPNTLNMDVVPEVIMVKDEDGNEISVGRIGVMRSPVEIITSSSLYSVPFKGAEATYKVCVFILKVVRGLITGDVSVKSLGGPVTITVESGRVAAWGIIPYLLFMAMISANLGVINLLPIPMLDGGHLFLLSIEAIRGKPLSERVTAAVMQVGLALILMLMVFVFYMDFLRYQDKLVEFVDGVKRGLRLK